MNPLDFENNQEQNNNNDDLDPLDKLMRLMMLHDLMESFNKKLEDEEVSEQGSSDEQNVKDSSKNFSFHNNPFTIDSILRGQKKEAKPLVKSVPKLTRPINKDDILNLRITLNVTNDVNDFIKEI